MPSRTNGLLPTILMLVPLSTVPLLAVFGIPQFVPVVASPTLDDGDLDGRPNSMPCVGESACDTPDSLVSPFRHPVHMVRENQAAQSDQSLIGSSVVWDDPFRQTDLEASNRSENSAPRTVAWGEDRADSVATSAQAPPQNNPRVSPDALDGWEPETSQWVSIVPSATDHSASPTTLKPEPLTWQSAVGRLNGLGIRRYCLQPGNRKRAFHFSCFFTPPANPRVTHRFEAEANEPLRAVGKVLEQIDDWVEQQ